MIVNNYNNYLCISVPCPTDNAARFRLQLQSNIKSHNSNDITDTNRTSESCAVLSKRKYHTITHTLICYMVVVLYIQRQYMYISTTMHINTKHRPLEVWPQ